MKKRTKKYSGPKRFVANPIAAFFGGMSDQHAAHLQETLLALHVSMSKLARGVGDAVDWNNVNQSINMGIIMTGKGIGREHADALRAGRDAMVSSVLRYHKTQKFGFSGEELKALNEAIECHDAMMTCVRGKEVDSAASELARRLKHKINTSSAYDPNIITILGT